MFASYNTGRGTLLRAQEIARTKTLDPSVWPSIQTVAPMFQSATRRNDRLRRKDRRHSKRMDDEAGRQVTRVTTGLPPLNP
jgi:membrane-bound lytic murein transglycosylase MltF